MSIAGITPATDVVIPGGPGRTEPAGDQRGRTLDGVQARLDALHKRAQNALQNAGEDAEKIAQIEATVAAKKAELIEKGKALADGESTRSNAPEVRAISPRRLDVVG